jgi:hypothetical protein
VEIQWKTPDELMAIAKTHAPRAKERKDNQEKLLKDCG